MLITSRRLYEIIPGAVSILSVSILASSTILYFFLWPPTRRLFFSFLSTLSSSFVASVRSRNLWRHVFVLDTRPLTSRRITVLPLLPRNQTVFNEIFLIVTVASAIFLLRALPVQRFPLYLPSGKNSFVPYRLPYPIVIYHRVFLCDYRS